MGYLLGYLLVGCHPAQTVQTGDLFEEKIMGICSHKQTNSTFNTVSTCAHPFGCFLACNSLGSVLVPHIINFDSTGAVFLLLFPSF